MGWETTTGHLLGLTNWLLPLLYLGLLTDYGVAFFLRVRPRGRSAWLPAVVAVHVLFLCLLAASLEHSPFVRSYGVLSVVAVSTAGVYWLVEFVTRERRTGAFVFLVVFLFQYTSSVLLLSGRAEAGAARFGAQAGASGLHILPAIVAYTALTIAAVYGVLHIVTQRNLKAHRFGFLFDRLPPLEPLGRMSGHALLVGLVFLSAAIGVGGFMFLRATPSGPGAWDPKMISKVAAGSVAWLICAAAVVGRLVGKWPALRVSRLAVGGFLVLMTMLVLSILLS